MAGELGASLDLLAQRHATLDVETGALAARVLDMREGLRTRLRLLGTQAGPLVTIRVHGDYHLGQVLVLQDDFVILDFEGEPARTLDERRARQPVLRDIAGMARSFSYAAEQAMTNAAGGDPNRAAHLELWAGRWAAHMSTAFLAGYLATNSARPLLPPDRDRLQAGLDLFVLDKAAYELRYELNNRPDWVRVPLKGLLSRDVLELPPA
jgi:maltose alpha-D-glucosyltransferase/alpha-amylase